MPDIQLHPGPRKPYPQGRGSRLIVFDGRLVKDDPDHADEDGNPKKVIIPYLKNYALIKSGMEAYHQHCLGPNFNADTILKPFRQS